MGYKLKGFFYGILLQLIYVLVLAPIIFLPLAGGLESCDYFCKVILFSEQYTNPFAFLFFLLNWFLGTKIAKLSFLLSERGGSFSKGDREFIWPWEHKISKIEDYRE